MDAECKDPALIVRINYKIYVSLEDCAGNIHLQLLV